MKQKENYHKYLVKLAQDQGGDFNSALIDTVARQCLAVVQETMQDIPGDEKWSPLGVAESIELRLAGLFSIDLTMSTGVTHEQPAETGSHDSQQ
jgi:hypothetical protein